ncbi:MAG TPA: DUF3107 domain-containing protein [Acidimicrobiia bacterium]|jgi:hypothetical protein
MEVRIGVVHTPKELMLDVDESADEVSAAVDRALAGGDAVLWLTDSKGRRIGVPSERLAYVEIETDHDAKRVGFGPG